MAEFGEQLRKAREAKGCTQQTLAEQLYVTRQTVSRWEGGERYPDLVNLKKLSEILGVSVDTLLDNREVAAAVEKNPILESPIQSHILSIFYALVVFSYAVLGLEMFPAYPISFDAMTQGGSMFLRLLVECGEIALFAYGLVVSVQGKMNARRAGVVTIGFFLLEAAQIAGLCAAAKSAVPVLLATPYLIGVIGAWCFYIWRKSNWGFVCAIAFATLFGVFRQVYTVYEMLMHADHAYTAVNTFGALLTSLVYVLFLYQLFVLARKRKTASSLAHE